MTLGLRITLGFTLLQENLVISRVLNLEFLDDRSTLRHDHFIAFDFGQLIATPLARISRARFLINLVASSHILYLNFLSMELFQVLKLLLRFRIKILVHSLELSFEVFILLIVVRNRFHLMLRVKVVFPQQDKKIPEKFVEILILNLTFVLLEGYLSVLSDLWQHGPELTLYRFGGLIFVI